MATNAATASQLELVSAFPTPMARIMVPGADQLNPQLRDIILDAERQRANSQKSNVGGWRSRADLFEWPHDAIRTLRGVVIQTVKQVTEAVVGQPIEGHYQDLHLCAWAIVNRDGHYNAAHVHPGYAWSGAYYVDDGEPDPSRPLNGCIEFLDPRAGIAMIRLPGQRRGSMPIPPQPGSLLLFPAWLLHTVHPFYGQRARIVISFNAVFTGRGLAGAPP